MFFFFKYVKKREEKKWISFWKISTLLGTLDQKGNLRLISPTWIITLISGFKVGSKFSFNTYYFIWIKKKNDCNLTKQNIQGPK